MNWDEIVKNIAMGNTDKHWENVIAVIMSADDKEYAKLYMVYSDLIAAIDKWNLKHKGVVDPRFTRKPKSR